MTLNVSLSLGSCDRYTEEAQSIRESTQDESLEYMLGICAFKRVSR